MLKMSLKCTWQQKVTKALRYTQKSSDNDEFLTLKAAIFGLMFLHAQKRHITPAHRRGKRRIFQCKNGAFVQSRGVKQTVCHFCTKVVQNLENA